MDYDRKAAQDFSWPDLDWEDMPALLVGTILLLILSLSTVGSLFW